MAEAPETLQCKVCSEVKPVSEFYMQSTDPAHRAYGRRQGRCKVCVRGQTGTYQREHRERASELQRRWRFLNQYGITPDDYDRILSDQQGTCAICLGPPRGRWKTFVVDHDHATGRPRGLLCGNCNRAIGLLGDNPDLMRAAVLYLTVEGGTE